MPDAAATIVAEFHSVSAPPASLTPSSLAPLTLVLGGARSGKSAYAETLLAGCGTPVYLATAEAGDAEMAARIQNHRQRRGPRWTTVEAAIDLADALQAQATAGRGEDRGAVLVDCLTLWVANLMAAGRDVEAEAERLAAVLPALSVPVVFVANEVGLGIVPDNALARRFRDHAGRLNQRLAQLCQRVVFVAAGLPLVLKEPGR